jgi:ABC-2 type transport system permease protein
VADAIADRFALAIHATALGIRAAVDAGALSLMEIPQASAAAAQAPPPYAVERVEIASRQLPMATFFVAGMGMFFIFLIVGLAVASVLEERQNGTLARLLAAPVPPAAIVAGKAVANVGLAVLAMVVLAGASTLIMQAEWGNPGFAFLVIVAAVLAAAGIMTLAGGLARTPAQAQALQSIVAMTLAMAGGSFVPIVAGSGIMATVQYLTPNAWFMRGLGDVVGGAYGEALRAAGILAGIGLVTGAIGLLLVQRSLKP